MRMVKVNGEVINPKRDNTMTYASGKLQDMIEGFADSGERVVRLIIGEGEYATIGSARTAVTQATKSVRKDYIKVKQANGNLFLLNELK